jgi:hypothetical protein
MAGAATFDVCSLHELVANWWKSGETEDCRMMYFEVGEGLHRADVCLLSARGVGLLLILESLDRSELLHFDSLR